MRLRIVALSARQETRPSRSLEWAEFALSTGDDAECDRYCLARLPSLGHALCFEKDLPTGIVAHPVRPGQRTHWQDRAVTFSQPGDSIPNDGERDERK